MKKIKIAQIGTSENSHGSPIWRRLLRLSDDFEVVGYALPESERKKFPKQMKYFDGYREMTVDEILNDPEIEAVVVETEEIYLTKYARMVADAGKHLHMEKPGSPDLVAFRALVARLKEKKLAFSAVPEAPSLRSTITARCTAPVFRSSARIRWRVRALSPRRGFGRRRTICVRSSI